MDIEQKEFKDEYGNKLKVFINAQDEGAVFEADGSPYLTKEQIKVLINYLDGNDIYSELRGLLKEHAKFPNQWDTDERLREWLIEKGELD